MKIVWLAQLLALLVFAFFSVASNAEAADTVELTSTENHHVIELNSDQPYVAGFHVNTLDLDTPQRGILATSITVSFPSTNTDHFPLDSWLAGGMFVQAQDSRYLHVDYGFYTMLVVDASGSLFVDIGLHQTREESTPIQMPTEELVYAYTWQISGIDYSACVTLNAKWDSEGWVHYSIYVNEENITFCSINVPELPSCENIIRKFYAGNVYNMPFPFGRYVQYFQFGAVSSEAINNNYWSVDLREPRFLTQTGWKSVDIAWSVEGDISYLDNDWRWGGVPYFGVSAQYFLNPLENPYEVCFSYGGQTLHSGVILWQVEDRSSYSSADGIVAGNSMYVGLSTIVLLMASTLLLFNLHKNS